MSRLRAEPAPRRLSTAEQIEAVFSSPALYELAQLIPRPPVGRPPANPPYVVLGYGVLARLYRSGIRVQTELSHPATWRLVHDTVARMVPQLPEGLVTRLPADQPATFEAFRNARDRYLTDPDIRAELQARFIDAAVRQARSFGLLRPDGPGSLCHPDRSRTIYGDGTVVRPLYRPPAARREIDRETGEVRVVYLDAAGDPIDAPTRRYDPDVAEYHGHAGPVFGQNFVAISVRGDAPQQRVVLAIDRVPRPGQEADTAVELIRQVHAVAGTGIQAVAYDGAFQGPQVDVGDGTVIDEYSRIRFDPAGQVGRWGYQHTRATAPHRVRYQQMRRNPKKVPDHKGKEGINFIGFYTWTPFGTVGFGSVAELGAEIDGAQPFIDALAAEIGEGFRFLDYDRVVTGWRRHRLMALHGISSVNRENAASSVDHEGARDYLERQARQIAATAGLTADKATLDALLRTTARTLIEQDTPLPLGINLYATTADYDAVNGKLYAYGTVTPDAAGHACEPELWADDGALWVVENGIKSARCIPRRSTAERLADGSHAQHTDWHIPCPHGGFEHRSVWYPQRTQQDSRRRDARQRALDNLRVPSRRDPGFKGANQRNLSESVNQTAQTTTQHHGRATSPDGGVQTLDMVCVHHMINAETNARAVRAGAY